MYQILLPVNVTGADELRQSLLLVNFMFPNRRNTDLCWNKSVWQDTTTTRMSESESTVLIQLRRLFTLIHKSNRHLFTVAQKLKL